MAMMITGRVLLVCALCVLWCLTVFGDARDNRCIEGDGNVLTHTHNGGNDGLRLKADSGLISTRMGLIKAVAAEEGGEEELESVGRASPDSLLAVTEDNEAPGPKEGKGAAVAATPPSMPGPGVPGTGDEKGQLPAAGQKGNEKNNVDPGSKEPKESQDRTNDQLPSPSGSTPTRSGEKSSLTGTDDLTPLPKGTETELSADPQDKNGSDEAIGEEDGEEEKKKKQEKNKLQPEKHEGQNNGGGTPPPPLPAPLQPSGGPAPSSTAGEGGPPAEKESSQNVTTVTNKNTPSGSKMESKAPEPPSGDATQGQHSHDTDTENSTKNAAAGSPAEPTNSSTSASGSGDHVQNKAGKDDAQSSEGQYDSIETGNTNVVPTLSEEAPRTAETITAAQINGTANTQNSDGSTAASHTTSPLLPLLLFVVACAAAVVAA
ncbi:mucin-associated surface protein [Trypanosoma cruzi cruzi]|uniref:Mucin-associated surface protein (MASP) n=1 Tax=Trypanosoma cruzi TaxID=5693 RepID=A0A2V2W9P8_TRYCR|nr:mucin-associated surface protein [Trypanosoma cruzi cruzi]PWV03304.1 Mucin-associated surface protein (MASP) [Trypanosoma cruzi]